MVPLVDAATRCVALSCAGDVNYRAGPPVSGSLCRSLTGVLGFAVRVVVREAKIDEYSVPRRFRLVFTRRGLRVGKLDRLERSASEHRAARLIQDGARVR